MKAVLRSRNIQKLEEEAEYIARKMGDDKILVVGLPVLGDDDVYYEVEVEEVKVEAGKDIKQEYWDAWKILKGGGR